ncbi:hypothetical protein EVAR_51417_1 [Eumeta japonica]|uniref:Uncharacterized protein n=1 Tax=Eumeta variegata TaxID=151549 RepID=A0A4C1XTP8_EUMVA|nr:hypothetical protein EVAR_51417_1 [Eumeta japonica]
MRPSTTRWDASVQNAKIKFIHYVDQSPPGGINAITIPKDIMAVEVTEQNIGCQWMERIASNSLKIKREGELIYRDKEVVPLTFTVIVWRPSSSADQPRIRRYDF